MEDLRSKEQQKEDKKTWSPNKSISTNTGHIPTTWIKIRKTAFKVVKKTYKYVLICGIIYVVLAYPNEIGTFIGDWSYAFWAGLTNKF